MADDWYRRETWTKEDESAFFSRLKRSRTQFHKAQYLRIQANYLEKTNPSVSLQLLDMIINEYPEPFELAQTYLQKAHCLVALSQKDEAISYFQKALEQEIAYSSALTEAYLDFPMFIVTEELKALYPQAKSILLKSSDRLMFPVDHYRWNLCLALISWSENEKRAAVRHAKAAKAATTKEHSGFCYHPKVGLVTNQDKRIQKLLKNIIASVPST